MAWVRIKGLVPELESDRRLPGRRTRGGRARGNEVAGAPSDHRRDHRSPLLNRILTEHHEVVRDQVETRGATPDSPSSSLSWPLGAESAGLGDQAVALLDAGPCAHVVEQSARFA